MTDHEEKRIVHNILVSAETLGRKFDSFRKLAMSGSRQRLIYAKNEVDDWLKLYNYDMQQFSDLPTKRTRNDFCEDHLRYMVEINTRTNEIFDSVTRYPRAKRTRDKPYQGSSNKTRYHQNDYYGSNEALAGDQFPNYQQNDYYGSKEALAGDQFPNYQKNTLNANVYHSNTAPANTSYERPYQAGPPAPKSAVPARNVLPTEPVVKTKAFTLSDNRKIPERVSIGVQCTPNDDKSIQIETSVSQGTQTDFLPSVVQKETDSRVACDPVNLVESPSVSVDKAKMLYELECRRIERQLREELRLIEIERLKDKAQAEKDAAAARLLKVEISTESHFAPILDSTFASLPLADGDSMSVDDDNLDESFLDDVSIHGLSNDNGSVSDTGEVFLSSPKRVGRIDPEMNDAFKRNKPKTSVYDRNVCDDSTHPDNDQYWLDWCSKFLINEQSSPLPRTEYLVRVNSYNDASFPFDLDESGGW